MTTPRTVLRYWLSMIRREEALTTAIRAAPPVRREPTVDLRDPGRGQTYFKVAPGDCENLAAMCVRRTQSLSIPMGLDRTLFFEHWLRRRYISRRSDDDGPQMMLGWPVIYQPRRGELAPLIRYPLESVVWKDATQQTWTAPTGRELRARMALVPPSSLHLRADEPEEGVPPFSFDELALTRLLGIGEEQIPWLTGDESGALDRLITLLRTSPEASTDELEASEILSGLDADDVLNSVSAEVRERLDPGRARVFPIALVYDGSTVFATHHLQRELRDLIERRADLAKGGPLERYLTCQVKAPTRGVHLGARGARQLTDDQRLVADRVAESALTVAQGPPGTGKTELILQLAAHALIEMLDPDDLATGLRLLVCSTNNRAVDNVVEPLADGDLPLALRVGSRRVMEQFTGPTLLRVVRWLREPREAPDATEAKQKLKAALKAVESTRREVLAGNRLLARRETAHAERAEARAERDALMDTVVGADVLEDVLRQMRLFAARLDAWLDRLKRTPESWRKLIAQWPDAVESTLETLEVPIAPTKETEPDDLDDAVDDALETVREALRAARRRDQLDETIAELTRVIDAEPPDVSARWDALKSEIAVHEPGLFEAALKVREAWAWEHRERLARSCADVAEIVRSRKSLRTLPADLMTDLQTLFPVWGCTLLSLGNALPLAPGCVERVVIDEAGQCHPAFATSALQRAKRCLLIGDENQLEPVIHLDRGEEARVLRRIGRPVIDAAFRTTTDDHNSAIRLARRACKDVPTLRDHFRCQAPIIAVSDRLCDYGLVVRTPVHESLHPRLPGPLVGLDVRGEQTSFIGSWRNDLEVDMVARWVGDLLSTGVSPGRIAVLTPYRGQLRAIDDALRRAGIPLFDATDADGRGGSQGMLFDVPSESVVTGTVHRFQGGERDVVLFSTVVTRARSLPFLNQRPNLVNVAVSRARRHLLVVGHRELLGQGRLTSVMTRSIPTWMS